MRFSVFQQSNIGGRKVNQDRLAYSFSRDVLLMVVADGMGGHARGEIAAEIAVATLNDRFQSEAKTVLRRPKEFLEASIHAAHRAIVAFADKNDMLECPRTTVVACIVQAGRAQWAHVGDSRLYLFRGGRLHAATLDHSRVQQMIEAGVLTPEAAAVHPDRNKIYNCLGGVLPPTITHSEEMELQVADSLLLSSDGFWGQLDAAFIAQKLQREDIVSLLPKLVEQAERKAGADADNVSVLGCTWERQDDDSPAAGVTVTGPIDGFTSSMTTTQEMGARKELVSDDDIERAIAEIQNAIKKLK